MKTDALRTPDERFYGLPGWPYAPHYVDDLPGYEGLRVHYVDEGPQNAVRTYLCLHGQPSWSYLYRKMIPVFLDSGARVIAPDWLGFGRSDKPVADETYTFHFHRNMMLELVKRLDLQQVTLVCQDWGGLLGLTLPPDMPDRFERLIVMNTTLATGTSPSDGFNAWKTYSASQPDMDVAALMKRGMPVLSDAEAAAYGAPFPDATYKAGVRRFPELVMVEPDMEGVETSQRAADWWARDWQGETFMAVGGADPVLGPPVMEKLRAQIRGCPEPMIIEEAGHFVQEWGAPVARAALEAFGEL
ncbi:haloalkane dehalogenase [Hyphomonas adhaerens]|uniref:haloalkane dehalogenase n=1 Tax=Hyphomonas adhaerens TaxID=81029 RepID=UPI002352208B|nr:haloalkane dehalogenase [Hyphomonas adhaerens]|tara:strand:- start:4461 stop:5363 length:903 start_codon:yes stop_codon:yes gene_type:complete